MSVVRRRLRLAIPLALSFSPTIFAADTLRQQVAAIAADAHGKVSVACSLPGSALNCDLNPHAHPPMQSVFKAFLAFTALHLVENRELSFDQSVRFRAGDRILPQTYSPLQDQYPAAEVDLPLRHLLELAVSQSDNVAADIVLRVVGGPAVVDHYIQATGISGFHLENNETQLHANKAAQYRNWLEPASAVQFLRLLYDHPPLSAEHAALLLGWMRDSTRANQRIKGRLPAGTVVMHKPGTSDTEHGVTAATNDIGLIAMPGGLTLAIAVFVTDSPANETTRDSVIARIARAAYDAALTPSAVAIDAMKKRGVEAVTVMQDVSTGAVVVSAASEPSKLDVTTQVTPLSLAKVYLAASWWDRKQPDQSENIHEMLVSGSDSVGRRVALALRKAVTADAVLADLRRYGFNGAAYARLSGLDEEHWSSALSIGESDMATTPLQVSRFFQAVGNGGLQCAPNGATATCKSPTRVVDATTAKRLIAAAIDTVKRGSAKHIAGTLDDIGWSIGGKTGTGGRAGAPIEAQDGWFAGLVFDRHGKARYTVATFVRRGGLGGVNAAEISAAAARFLAER
jgi:beta-lactamase class A